MKKLKGIFFKISSLLLILLILVSTTISIPITANAATVTKTEKSYDIAVVFDNSGSMYSPNDNMSWCRAKYAMEIFASMLNYDKDRLRIFPMWEVVTDGSTSAGGSKNAIEVKSIDDIQKIHNIYTPNPLGTPFDTVTDAYSSLLSSNADEKWLLVLTDGTFDGGIKSDKLRSELKKMANGNIKVQYLGIGNSDSIAADESSGLYSKKSTDTSLKDDLIEICNLIFQRSILPSNYLKGNKLNLDISMKNVIVFVQGTNAKIVSLKSSNGKEVKPISNSGQRKYSTISNGRYPDVKADTSLAGQVVTFDACSKGEYTLEYSGADKIQVFYEPDVDIDVSLINSDGQKITKADDFYAGEYTVSSKIVDRTTGEDVTTHELMGKDVKLKTYVKTSKDSEKKEYENGAKITFEPDSETEIWIEGEYLGKYKISSKDDPDLKWLCPINIPEPAIKFNVEATVTQSGEWYKLSDHDEWKPIKVTLSVDGQPLTDEQLKAANFTVSGAEKLKYRCEPLLGESAYNVFIAQDETGKYIEPDIGKYNLKFDATYTDEFGKETNASDTATFEIAKYSAFLAWLLRNLWWILLIIASILLWLFYMTRKVLPKKIVKDNARFNSISAGELDGSGVDVRYNPKSKSLKISGPTSVEFDEQCAATFSLKPIDNHFTASNKRRFAIVGISSQCEELKLGATPYVNYNGSWIKKTKLRTASTGNFTPESLNHEMSANPKFELQRAPGGVLQSTLKCDTRTRK